MKMKQKKVSRRTNKTGKVFENEKGGWAITFCGFVLILLAFFIMLSSFATMEQSKIAQFVKSFSHAISFLEGGVKFGLGDILIESPDIMSKKSADVISQLKHMVKRLEMDEEIVFSITQRGLVMTVIDKALFELGSAEIASEAFPLLNSIAKIISQSDFPVRIEGHTDNLPIHNERFPSNWELSTSRAVNILRYFVENEQISPKKLSAVGYAEFQPLFPNDTPEHRAKNRRVEILFVHAEMDVPSELRVDE